MFRNIFLFCILTFILIISPVSALGSADIDLSTNFVKMCPCGTTQVIGSLENIGNEKQTYNIKSSSEWVTIAPDKVTLEAGGVETVYAYLNPFCSVAPKDYQASVYVESGGEILDEELIELNLLNCYGVDLSVDSPIKTGCFGDLAVFQVYLKNTGKTKEVFDLDTSEGILSQEIIEVKSGEEKNMLLSVPITKDKESIILSVTSQNRESYAMDSENLEVRGMQCSGVAVLIDPEEQEVCEGDVAEYAITVKNTGKNEDSFEISSTLGDAVERVIELDSGKTKETTLKVLTDLVDIGEYEFSVTAESSVSDSVEGNLIVINKNDCYGFKTGVSPEKIKIDSPKGSLYTITVENTGKFSSDYTIIASGPEWMYVDPKNFSLDSGEKKEVYVYMSPTFGIEEGIYTIDIEIGNDKGIFGSEKIQLTYGNVSKEILPEKEEEIEKVEEVKEDKGNILLISIIIGIAAVLLIVFRPKLLKRVKEPKKKKGRGRPKKSKKEDIKEILNNI